MKTKKKLIMIIMSMLVMTACFFCGETKTHAKTVLDSNQVLNGIGIESVILNNDIPSEIQEPIKKGVSLIVYLVISAGVVIALVGIILGGIAWIGHQPDMKINALIFIIVGAIVALGPVIINWLIPNSGLL